MEMLIITGLSGSGKTRTLNALEDIGYYCMDNMPPALISKFTDLIKSSESLIQKVAIMCDIRGGSLFNAFLQELDQLIEQNIRYKLVYIDCDFSVMVRRYKETRRRHPLIDQVDNSIEAAVKLEMTLLSDVRERADYVINTSMFSPTQLKNYVSDLFLENKTGSITVSCVSFGSKHGAVTDADLLFDVRCLVNPFYEEKLRTLTGLDDEVSDYVMSSPPSVELFAKITDMVDFLLPLYIAEGKSSLVIAFGCTGGKHRSVTFARLLCDHLNKNNIKAICNHRDLTRM